MDRDLQIIIQSFVAGCTQPVLSEPGEELIELRADNFSLEPRGLTVSLQAWDSRRNLVRKVTQVETQSKSRLVLRVDRFGKKAGTLAILDFKKADAREVNLRASRLEGREVFRRLLHREFTGFQIAALSTEANLEESLSPAYPRALLRNGAAGLAAIYAGPGSAVDGILSFGLIWLDYLRRRDQDSVVAGLVLFVPAGQERNTCLRLQHLDPASGRFSLYVYDEDGNSRAVDPLDSGNIDTKLNPCQCGLSGNLEQAAPRIAEIPDVETIAGSDGSVSYRVHGLEFARLAGEELTFGLETKRRIRASTVSDGQWNEIEALARQVARFRSAHPRDQQHPLFLRHREAWLESQVRAHLEQLDPTLHVNPVYGQVPAFAAGERGIIDLLAVDRNGRLAVLELKASPDIHLPLQALDYWIRVKWHLDRGEFAANGYFPGMRLRDEAPRLLLVAPALDFHPTNERVLRFFSPSVSVERLGVGVEWQQRLKLMYRM